jgi:hypothetical protein
MVFPRRPHHSNQIRCGATCQKCSSWMQAILPHAGCTSHMPWYVTMPCILQTYTQPRHALHQPTHVWLVGEWWRCSAHQCSHFGANPSICPLSSQHHESIRLVSLLPKRYSERATSCVLPPHVPRIRVIHRHATNAKVLLDCITCTRVHNGRHCTASRIRC